MGLNSTNTQVRGLAASLPWLEEELGPPYRELRAETYFRVAKPFQLNGIMQPVGNFAQGKDWDKAMEYRGAPVLWEDGYLVEMSAREVKKKMAENEAANN